MLAPWKESYNKPVKVKVKSLSRIRLFATPWTAAYQAPQSMEFSRQEYWSGLPFPSPGVLPDPGIEPGSPALKTDSFFFLFLKFYFIFKFYIIVLVLPNIKMNPPQVYIRTFNQTILKESVLSVHWKD